MNGDKGYMVYFFPQALEALGEAIKPYLQAGAAGDHVVCDEIDTAGSLIEMTLLGRSPEGRSVSVELMVPSGMVRMIVSAHGEGVFGFGPHAYAAPQSSLPALGPTVQLEPGVQVGVQPPDRPVEVEDPGNVDPGKD